MKLPNGEQAIVERDKLADYCLNPNHPRGKHKARVFSAALGMTAGHVEVLRKALLDAAVNGDAERSIADRYGVRYVIDFPVTGPSGSAELRSTWIIRHGETEPRLTTCYVK